MIKEQINYKFFLTTSFTISLNRFLDYIKLKYQEYGFFLVYFFRMNNLDILKSQLITYHTGSFKLIIDEIGYVLESFNINFTE